MEIFFKVMAYEAIKYLHISQRTHAVAITWIIINHTQR